VGVRVAVLVGVPRGIDALAWSVLASNDGRLMARIKLLTRRTTAVHG
jgi:hypothetical protein